MLFLGLIIMKIKQALLRLSRPSLWAVLVLMALVLIYSDKEEPDCRTLAEKLDDLHGVTAIPTDPVFENTELFLLEITQAVDHNNPGGPTFVQEAYLHHAAVELPMVFGPAGYGATKWMDRELRKILGANMLIVTHRYFEGAEPDPLDWGFLNIEQAAADHHQVVELFREIYGGVWLSSGASKSGKTALFHRRFYPNDVDATVASVAPIVFGTCDERMIPYLEGVGTADCREAQKSYERKLLENRDALIPKFVKWFTDHRYSLSLDPDVAFEYAVLDYHFYFWQYHRVPCEEIPGETATVDELFDHMVKVLWMRLYADSYLDYYTPFFFQCMIETGYPAYVTAHLSDLLEVVTDPGGEDFIFADVTTTYKPSVMLDINHWLKTEGDNIIYIYGKYDPWTAAMFEPGDGTNAFSIVQPEADHRVRIKDLDEQDRVLDSLEVWLGMEVNNRNK